MSGTPTSTEVCELILYPRSKSYVAIVPMLKSAPWICTKAVGPGVVALPLTLLVMSGVLSFSSGVDCALPDCAIKNKATNRNV